MRGNPFLLYCNCFLGSTLLVNGFRLQVYKKKKCFSALRLFEKDMSMKMMVRDNFVHGDMHGGNILYSMSENHVTVLDAGIATSLDKRLAGMTFCENSCG